MKQRITIEQLNELSGQQKERLREWWNPEPSDHFTNGNADDFYVGSLVRSPGKFITYGDDIPHGKEGLLPLLSIGKMIEILHERNWFYELSFTKEIEDSPHEDTWHVYTTSVGSYKVKEPCDGLWEAVKEVL